MKKIRVIRYTIKAKCPVCNHEAEIVMQTNTDPYGYLPIGVHKDPIPWTCSDCGKLFHIHHWLEVQTTIEQIGNNKNPKWE